MSKSGGTRKGRMAISVKHPRAAAGQVPPRGRFGMSAN